MPIDFVPDDKSNIDFKEINFIPDEIDEKSLTKYRVGKEEYQKSGTIGGEKVDIPVSNLEESTLLNPGISRQAGLATRSAVEGATAFPATVGEELNESLNNAVDLVNQHYGLKLPKFSSPKERINYAISGLPQPETPYENIMSDVTKGAASSLIAPGKIIPQVIGGAASGLASGSAKELGLSPTAQLAAGITAGVVAPAAGAMLPNVKESAKRLIKEGVELTPGAMVGKGIQRTENAATSLPVLGDAINSAKRDSIISFNRATLNRVLSPIGKSIDKNSPVGYVGIDNAHQTVNNFYDEILSNVSVKRSPSFGRNLQNVVSDSLDLPPDQQKQLIGILEKDVASRFNEKGELPPGIYKDIDSKLRFLISSYSKSNNPDHHLLSKSIISVRDALTDLLKEQNPRLAIKHKQANTAWANLVRVEKAASSTGAKEGIFSPAQLNQAIKATDTSARKSMVARGKSLMQDLATDAERVIGGEPVPDSGTPLRSLISLLTLGGTAALNPKITAGVLAAAGMYTKPMRKIINKSLSADKNKLIPVVTGGALGTIANIEE